jgi:DUF1680 family protein
MKIRLLILSFPLFLLASCAGRQKDEVADAGVTGYPITPVSFTEVKVTDGFWAPRIEINRTVTIPFAMKKNEETGRVDNFRKAAGLMGGNYTGRRFNDTDIYKVLEGVAFSLKVNPDPLLEASADSLIALIALAQEDDGYLYGARTAHPDNPAPGAGSERWINLQGSHELYNSGHLFEAAVAYYEATGKHNFLDIAEKNADLLVRTFGPDGRHDAPGHQVVEMGLAKIFLATGKREYLELARFFLDERGRLHASEPYPEGPFAMYNGLEYKQDHLPVKQQAEAVGHAVRATYMYAGMADVASLLGDKEYDKAIGAIWENVVGKKMYLTGGVGSRGGTEAFGDNYELPNEGAYCETCAAIGNAFWNQRMFLSHGDAKYVDVLEKVMYNGLISGVSLSGDRFFYQNPLASYSNYRRSEWFDVSCCPGNIVRFLPSVPGYIYARRGNELFVNLFVDSHAETELASGTVKVTQTTNYPYEGTVRITVTPAFSEKMTLSLRIPGWARGEAVPSDLYLFTDSIPGKISVSVNGKEQDITQKNGYISLERRWGKGDEIVIELPMAVRVVTSNPGIAGNESLVALQRGPLVYCFESTDNTSPVREMAIGDPESFSSHFDPELLNGTTILEGTGLDSGGKAIAARAIPYCLWANRGDSNMAVWMKKTH